MWFVAYGVWHLAWQVVWHVRYDIWHVMWYGIWCVAFVMVSDVARGLTVGLCHLV